MQKFLVTFLQECIYLPWREEREYQSDISGESDD
jgi:hypothetical protein